jgi:hypothetical protein
LKVEELSRYGKTLTGLPKETKRKVMAIVFHEIRKKFGLLGVLPFFIKAFLEQRALKKKYPEAYRETLKLGKAEAQDITIFIAIFILIARKEGRENGYEFVKGIMQKIAIYSMPAFYQIDDLVKCEGDTFENFVKFTVAWFDAMNEEGTWIVEDMQKEKDNLSFKVTKCTNCVIGDAFDCPEIAKLGCDHDLAGYPVILDKVDAEFRRPHTIAKGDDYCDFHFYRKGTAPDTEHLNK